MTTDEIARLKALIANLPPGPYELEGPMEPETWIVQAGQQAYEWRPIAFVPQPDPEDGWSLTQTQANAAALAGLLNHAGDLLALAESHARLLAAAQKAFERVDADSEHNGYGFARPDDPRDFHPEPSCCTPGELENHRKAVELWEAAGGNPEGWVPPKGSEWEDRGAEGLVHVLRAPWGIGTYTFRDAELCELADELRAAIEAAPKGDTE